MPFLSRKILTHGRPLLILLSLGSTGAIGAAQEQWSSPTAHKTHLPRASADATTDEAPFIAANTVAMNKMMTDMAIKPTGNLDRDFVAMMAPHHQGAIDMAQAYLRQGANEQLKRLAQEIIVTQQQEIAAMRLAVGEPLPPSTASPTQSIAERAFPGSAPHDSMAMPANAMKTK